MMRMIGFTEWSALVILDVVDVQTIIAKQTVATRAQTGNLVTLVTISNGVLGILFYTRQTGKGVTLITISNGVLGILYYTRDTCSC